MIRGDGSVMMQHGVYILKISQEFLKSTQIYLKFHKKVKLISVAKDHRLFFIQIEVLNPNQPTETYMVDYERSN